MGRFSDFERKVDEMAELSDLERKVAWTWLLTLAPTLAVTWWIDGLPVRTKYCSGPPDASIVTCGPDRFLIWKQPKTVWVWTPTIHILIAAVGALVLLIAYLRIWKRTDES